ncbi:hypothetical protein JCM8097_000190 [Rhodosporidiobolus ruineniae]
MATIAALSPLDTSTSTLDPRSHSSSSSLSAGRSTWDALAAQYRQGRAALDTAQVPVLQPAELHFDEQAAAAVGEGQRMQLDGGAAGTRGTKEYVTEVFKRKGYLPALANPREDSRQQTLHRYSLHQVGKVPAIDELAELAREVFDVECCVVNVVLEDRVVFVSTAGWSESERDPDAPPIAVDADVSFCPHAMQKDSDAGCFMISDTSQDWRFKHSPLAANGQGPIGFFASSNINLPALGSSGEAAPNALPVGSFCLLNKTPREGLTERQQRTLKKLAQMAAKEFELAFQRERNAVSERRNSYIAELFRSLLVYPSRAFSATTGTRCDLGGVARDIVRHTPGDFCAILDLRSFNAFIRSASPTSASSSRFANPTTEDGEKLHFVGDYDANGQASPISRENTREAMERLRQSLGRSRRDPNIYGPGSVQVVDCWCDRHSESTRREDVDLMRTWLGAFVAPTGLDVIGNALSDYHSDRRMSHALPAPVAPAFSALVPADTTALLTVPIFDHEGEPALYVIVGSRERYNVFEESDERFVNGVGGILMGSLLQERILAADQAKLAFVSQTSHELRTPIFAIAGNLDLVRQLSDPSALETIAPLLDIADVSLATLRDVLDDCLEYSKLSNYNAQSPSERAPAPKLLPHNLEKLASDTIKSCWYRAKQAHAAIEGSSSVSALDDVDILLESHLPPGLEANVDVGALKRSLMNCVGNSVKFTERGSITVRLSEQVEPVSSALPRRFKFEIIDTGRGMSEDFVRNHLFTAFKQADSFAGGAGLGVSLASQLVARMGGTISYTSELGAGTTATIVIPLEVVSDPSRSSPPSTPTIRNLSLELASHCRFPSSSTGSISSRTASPAPSISSLTAPPSPPQPSVSPATGLATGPSRTEAAKEEDTRRTAQLAGGAAASLNGSAGGNAGGADDDGKSRLRVLVVDDNPIARRILCTFLKTKGITFAEAAGGAEAIELFKSFSPNLVWQDWQMPDINGNQASRAMREYEVESGLPKARIVAVSGLDSTIGEHGAVLESGQIDKWTVKSGTSLKELTADLVAYAKQLDLGFLA